MAGRKDYANLLAELGFLPRDYADHMGSTGPANGFMSPFDQYSENARIVKAALCAGLVHLPCPVLFRLLHMRKKLSSVMVSVPRWDRTCPIGDCSDLVPVPCTAWLNLLN